MTHDIGISVCIGAGGSMADTGNAVNTAYNAFCRSTFSFLINVFPFIFETNTAFEKNITTCLFRSNRQYHSYNGDVSFLWEKWKL